MSNINRQEHTVNEKIELDEEVIIPDILCEMFELENDFKNRNSSNNNSKDVVKNIEHNKILKLEVENINDDPLHGRSSSTFTTNDKPAIIASENISSSNLNTIINDENTILNNPINKGKLIDSAHNLPIDVVQKFVTGEIIFDKQNPFKNPVDEETNDNLKLNKLQAIDSDEYVSKEDVLNESKYVKTYIKNPDPYLTYDPNVIETLISQENIERRRLKKLPIININELNKYDVPIRRNDKQVPKKNNPNINFVDFKLPVNNNKPTTRVINNANSSYPNLSDIKVKIGTDIDVSLFNSTEVMENAKKFDDRVNSTRFGSQDDIDDVAAVTLDACDLSTIDEKHQEKNIDEHKVQMSHQQQQRILDNKMKMANDENKKQKNIQQNLPRSSSSIDRKSLENNQPAYIQKPKLKAPIIVVGDSRRTPAPFIKYQSLLLPSPNKPLNRSSSDVIYDKTRGMPFQKRFSYNDPDFIYRLHQRNMIRNQPTDRPNIGTQHYLERRPAQLQPARPTSSSIVNNGIPQNQNPNILLRKPAVSTTMNRDDIMKRLATFYRKSLNNEYSKVSPSQSPLPMSSNSNVNSTTSIYSNYGILQGNKNIPKVPYRFESLPKLNTNTNPPNTKINLNKNPTFNHDEISYKSNSIKLRNNIVNQENNLDRLSTAANDDEPDTITYRQNNINRFIPIAFKPNTNYQTNQFCDNNDNNNNNNNNVNYINTTDQPIYISKSINRPLPPAAQPTAIVNTRIQLQQSNANGLHSPELRTYTGRDEPIIYRNSNLNTIDYRKINSPQYNKTNFPINYYDPNVIAKINREEEEIEKIYQNKQETVSYEDWQNDKGRVQQIEAVAEEKRNRNHSGGTGRREEPNRRLPPANDMRQYIQVPVGRSFDAENTPIRGYTPVNQGPLFDDDPGIMSEVETASTGFRRGGKQRSSLPVVRTPSKTLERPLGLVFLQYRSETKRALLPNEITSIDTVRALFVRSFPRQLTMIYLEGPNVKIYIHDANKDMFYELEDVRSHLREIRDRSVLRLFESNEVVIPHQFPGGSGVPQPITANIGPWDQDQNYFSEPEFDSEFQHQHIHKSKNGKGTSIYIGGAQTLPRGMYSERNKNMIAGPPVKPLRSYGSRGSIGPSSSFPYTPEQLYTIPDGYMSSPERSTRSGYEEPYYSQYVSRGSTVTPIIDEEQSDTSMVEDQYASYGHKVGGGGGRSRNPNQMYDPNRENFHRHRVEHLERQLSNLTGLVQKLSLNQYVPNINTPQIINSNYLGVPVQHRGDETDGHSNGSSTSIQANGIGDDTYVREKPPKLGKSSCHKSVSFEKSVSFSDDIQGGPKSHNPQHPADLRPPKPAIKSSTLPRTSSQERDRLKPPTPPKPLGLTPAHNNYRPDITLAPEVYNHLRNLQKKAKDLRMEMRTLRRLSQAQVVAVREEIKDAFMGIRATLLATSFSDWKQTDERDQIRLSREEELYKQEVMRLEKDLSDLESCVEGLRGEVINRRTRVNMTAVEDMALVLSRASKTVAELKMKFPDLQLSLHNQLEKEMDKVAREEQFLKDEPDRLESALRRCKKLTGTLVTLKRLASVQEQRLPNSDVPASEESVTILSSRTPDTSQISTSNKPIPSPRLGTISINGGTSPENALDALLDELQTFAKPPTGSTNNKEIRTDDSNSDDNSQILHNNNILKTQFDTQKTQPTSATFTVTQMPTETADNYNVNVGLRRLHSYPSGSDTDNSPPQPQRTTTGKPPVPERNADLLTKVTNKRIPPPPPPRTSSRSPLASPTSPNIPAQYHHHHHHQTTATTTGTGTTTNRLPSVLETLSYTDQVELNNNHSNILNSSSGDEHHSGKLNSQEHNQRQLTLDIRHKELLRKQKQLQEQYARLHNMRNIDNNNIMNAGSDMIQLKKTGSESNLPQKMGFNMSVVTGSMKNLNNIDVMETGSNQTKKPIINIDFMNHMSSNDRTNVNDHNDFDEQKKSTTELYETEIL